MSVQGDNHAGSAADLAGEETRHACVLALTVATPNALVTLLSSLGDTSWRVRKAALNAVERLRAEPTLVHALIDGLGSHDNAGLRNACAEALAQLGEIAVPELSAVLRTIDLDQRKFIVEVLGLIGTRSARQSLLGALDETDSNVRAAVVDALGQIGGPEVVHELTARLASQPEDLQLAVYVLDALARVQARLPVAQLLGWLNQRQLARFVYPLLGLSQDKAAFAALVSGATASSRGTRRMALPALKRLIGELGPVYEAELSQLLRAQAATREALLECCQEDDDHVAEAAVLLLGILGDVRDAAAVLQVCASRGLLQAGMRAIAHMGSGTVALLLAALEAVDTQTQLLFLDAIEAVGDAGAVPELLKLATSGNPYTAGAAMRALGRLAGPESIALLMNVARRAEPELVRQAVFALDGIGVRHAEAVAHAVRRAIEAGDVEPAWLAVLGSVGRPEDVDVVIGACRHLDYAVRVAAVEAAQAFGSRVPESCVIASLADGEARVRAAAARALSAYRGDVVLAALLEAVHDSDPWVVAEAARALGAVGGRRATQALQLAANSSVAPIVIAALQSLSRLEPQGLVATLRKSLRHADPEVVREALGVAARLDAGFASEALTEGLQHRSWDVRLAAASLLVANGLRVPLGMVEGSLAREAEPLVREKLERLRDMLGAST